VRKVLTLVLALVALGIVPGLSVAQESRQAVRAEEAVVRPVVDGEIPCPVPVHINLTAPPPTTPTPDPADFPAGTQSANFGGTSINQDFKDTFHWKLPGDCCQIISGKLTLRYKALQGGSAGSPTSANDRVSIIKNGSAVLTQPLYTGAVATGFTTTKTLSLTPAMLTNNRLSFGVEDDTSVLSASLEVVACCLRK
jgi:hypothetical protein